MYYRRGYSEMSDEEFVVSVVIIGIFLSCLCFFFVDGAVETHTMQTEITCHEFVANHWIGKLHYNDTWNFCIGERGKVETKKEIYDAKKDGDLTKVTYGVGRFTGRYYYWKAE